MISINRINLEKIPGVNRDETYTFLSINRKVNNNDNDGITSRWVID
jgi:hypothetical protein